jgi:hypothetical protein
MGPVLCLLAFAAAPVSGFGLFPSFSVAAPRTAGAAAAVRRGVEARGAHGIVMEGGIGRSSIDLADAVTSGMASLLRPSSGAFVAGYRAQPDQSYKNPSFDLPLREFSESLPKTRPQKTLELYEFEACPFCRKVSPRHPIARAPRAAPASPAASTRLGSRAGRSRKRRAPQKAPGAPVPRAPAAAPTARAAPRCARPSRCSTSMSSSTPAPRTAPGTRPHAQLRPRRRARAHAGAPTGGRGVRSYRPQAVSLGGKAQFPYLVDPNTGPAPPRPGPWVVAERCHCALPSNAATKRVLALGRGMHHADRGFLRPAPRAGASRERSGSHAGWAARARRATPVLTRRAASPTP